MGVRQRVAAVVRGRSGSTALASGLAALERELRDLQLKVQSLTDVVERLDASAASVGADIDAARRATDARLREVVDDLGGRLGAMSRRLDAADR